MKETRFNTDARDALKSGVDKLAEAVKVTLGPKGRHVIIEKAYGGPHATKDGVTVAKEMTLKDPVENMGAQMVKEVASNTADEAGDGTTTATVLTQAFVTEGLKNVAAGANPIDLKKGMDKAVIEVIKNLKEISKPIKSNEQIKQIGTISANNDEHIGGLIADAMKEVGNNGVITVEESKGLETHIEITEGMQLDRGYISPYFTTTEDMKALLDNPYILITSDKISKIEPLLPVIDQVGDNALLIIADDVEGEALNALTVNKLRGSLKVCIIKAPGFGERRKDLLEDIAVLTGGCVIDSNKGMNLEGITTEDLGQCSKITITKDSTTIVDGGGDLEQIKTRAAHINTQMKDASTDFLRETFQSRYGKLTGGVATLHVGATTEVEMREIKDRVDDALAATRAAIEEGVLPGGGSALIRARESIQDLHAINDDVRTGYNIVYNGVTTPMKQIVINGGGSGDVVISKMSDTVIPIGYNAKTEVWENLIDAGVIDPTKVVITALKNAVSVASMIITTECTITGLPEDPAQAPIL